MGVAEVDWWRLPKVEYIPVALLPEIVCWILKDPDLSGEYLLRWVRSLHRVWVPSYGRWVGLRKDQRARLVKLTKEAQK